MDAFEIRHRNLLALIEGVERRGITKVKDQAAALGMSSSYLGQLRGGDKLAPKPMGETVARKLEKAVRKPHGWMDQLHDGDSGAPASSSHPLRLDPEIVSAAHRSLNEMYALKQRVYPKDDVARFLLVYEKFAMRKAGVPEAELLGAGLEDTEMPQGASSGRDDGVPDAGTDKGAVARRVRR